MNENYVETKILRKYYDKDIKILRDYFSQFGVYICGGFAKYCVTSNECINPIYNDIDIYFSTKNMYKYFVLKHLTAIYKYKDASHKTSTWNYNSKATYKLSDFEFSELKNDNIKSFGKSGNHFLSDKIYIQSVYHKSDNFINLYCYIFDDEYNYKNYNDDFWGIENFYKPNYGSLINTKIKTSPYIIQIIHPDVYMKEDQQYASIYDILDDYDFSLCSCGIDVSKNKAYVYKDFNYDCSVNNLNIKKSIENPIKEFLRIFKYIKKGYSLNIVDIIKLFKSWECNIDSSLKNDVYDVLERIIELTYNQKDLSTEELEENKQIINNQINYLFKKFDISYYDQNDIY